MSSHDPFGHFKHKLWPKERSGVKFVNCQIWLLTTKSQESLGFLMCKWHATYCWKDLDKGYNFPLNLIPIRGLHIKLWTSKVTRVLILGKFWESYLGVPGQNDIWVFAPWPIKEYTIRGKVVASSESGPWWILWVHVWPWFVHALKRCSNSTLTNLSFGWCKSAWIIELLIAHPNPIPKLQHTLLPPKCCEPGSAPQFLFLPLSSPLDSQLNPSRSLGCVTFSIQILRIFVHTTFFSRKIMINLGRW
jgi:hypothetical protein